MITDKIAINLNKQLNNEFYSAYFYLSMSAYSSHLGFKGCADWFMMKNEEETDHAMRIYKYILDQGSQINLLSISGPPKSFKNISEMFKETLKHEQEITKNIHYLMDLALSEKDHATQIFLQWFVTEQVEEEATVGEIIDRFKIIGEKTDALFNIDNELGQIVLKNKEPLIK
jgi:ferritin